ncbi:TPA: hypothetical protein EYO12_00605 [Candidatus Saccharibacteria bacterium]|nr:hypothetical protein [Candidatus Saccharibacteria bacterium]HIO87596.1 hypothetical protein [Candidatus Saccharibacteria bacterium]
MADKSKYEITEHDDGRLTVVAPAGADVNVRIDWSGAVIVTLTPQETGLKQALGADFFDISEELLQNSPPLRPNHPEDKRPGEVYLKKENVSVEPPESSLPHRHRMSY